MAPKASSYDLFLSYNSPDHDVVEDIALRLRNEGLEPFLDRWYLAPGARWRTKLEDTLSSSKAVAIFVGPVIWAPGNRERWTSHSTFRVETPICQSSRYYSLAANLRWDFFVN